METTRGELKQADILPFITAGNARITIQNTETGNRFTFKVRKPKKDTPHFVSVLTGSDNETNYTYLGTIFNEADYKRTAKSKIGADVPSAKAFAWFWRQLQAGVELPKQLKVYHEGRCGRCGRTLTVPKSIESGLGPDCRKLMNIS